MSKQIYVNLPVKDLAVSTAFYEALGFTKVPEYSDDKGSGMKWSEEIFVMLLKHDFYKTFLRDKDVADASKTSGVLLALSLDSKAAVQQFADTAKAHGGDYYKVNMMVSEDQMFGYEVLDPDGHGWEPMWMSPGFNPST